MLIKRIQETIEAHNLIQPGYTVVVGISGGPDSVCLLHILNSLSSKFNLSLYAVHINHMLRGEESLQDEEYVRTLCACLGIELSVARFDINEISKSLGVSLEVAGRTTRYREMEHTADKVNAQAIAVAHNMNDQAETIFMNIVRGTGLSGLSGMPYKRGRIVRPLLDIRRNEIEEYCNQNELNPRIDSSNLEDVYTRNKVRLNIMPKIDKSFNIDIISSLFKMAEIVREENDFIEGFSKEYFFKCVKARKRKIIVLDVNKFKKAHSAIQKRIVRRTVCEVKGNIKDFGRVHTDEVMKLALYGSTGSVVHLPGHLRVEKSYDELLFYMSDITGEKPFCYKVVIPGMTDLIDSSAKLKAQVLQKHLCTEDYKKKTQKSLTQLFDYDKVIGGIYIRTREKGDVFNPFKSPGTKKLKDYFIDNKFSRNERNKIPLIAYGNEIIWVIGHKISDKFKVTENTKSILLLEYIIDAT